jgi:hypothetical protein
MAFGHRWDVCLRPDRGAGSRTRRWGFGMLRSPPRDPVPCILPSCGSRGNPIARCCHTELYSGAQQPQLTSGLLNGSADGERVVGMVVGTD